MYTPAAQAATSAAAAEVAGKQVHGGTREHVAGEQHEVVRGDRADDLGRQICGVVRNEQLQVDPVAVVPSERSAGEDVVRRTEEVVPALVLHPPEGGHPPRRVRAVADDRGAEIVDERPEQDGDEDGGCEQRDGDLPDEAAEPTARRFPCEVADSGCEREDGRVDEELVRGEHRRADDEVREDDVFRARGNECQDRELHRDGAGDDPGEARLAAREVEADEDVHERKERHRRGEEDEEVAAVRELGAEARAHEAPTGHSVEQGQERPEGCRHEEGSSEDVLRVLPACLTGCRHGEKHRQDRRGEKERNACKGRRRCILAGDVR